MAREALQFSEVAIKLTALGFKNSLALALAYAKENPKVRGKTSLDRLLRENKELKVIPIKTEDVSQFKGQFRVSHRQLHSCHGKALLYRGGPANHNWHQPRYGVQALGAKGVSLDKNRFCLQNLEKEF